MPLSMGQCVAVGLMAFAGGSASARSVPAEPAGRDGIGRPEMAIVSYNLNAASPAGTRIDRRPGGLRQTRRVDAAVVAAAAIARPEVRGGDGLSAVYGYARRRPSLRILGQRVTLSGFMVTPNRTVVVFSTAF